MPAKEVELSDSQIEQLNELVNLYFFNEPASPVRETERIELAHTSPQPDRNQVRGGGMLLRLASRTKRTRQS